MKVINDSSIKTCKGLRLRLATLFDKIETGTIGVKEAAQMSNVAGKMVASAKAQLEYAALRKERPRIAFLQE